MNGISPYISIRLFVISFTVVIFTMLKSCTPCTAVYRPNHESHHTQGMNALMEKRGIEARCQV